MTRRLIAAVVAVCAALLISGCGKAADKVSEKAVEKQIEKDAAKNGEDVDVDINDDEVSIESSDGSVTIGKDQLPADFPADEIPLVDGKIQVAMAADEGWTISLEVDGAADAAMQEAVDKLKAAGFSTTEGMEAQSMAMLENDAYSVMVTSSGDTGTNIVGYFVSKR